jgi:hypothetical protein
MHHLTSGMKSVFTQSTNDGLFAIRQSLAYTAWSGIPAIIEAFNPCVTFEGDNTVMAQQSARFLQKMYKRVKNGEKLSGVYDYMNAVNTVSLQKCQAQSVEDFCNIKLVEDALCNMSLFTIVSTLE